MRKKILAALLSLTMIAPMIASTPVMATEKLTSKSGSIYDGYFLKWSDEFNDTELNTDNWNIEEHEAGWVNSELQEYVTDDGNINLVDGKLVITPKKTSREGTEYRVKGAKNLLNNADFSNGLEGWSETIANWNDSYVTDASSSIADGGITYSIKNPGTDAWHVQLKQLVNLEAGKKYVMFYTIKSNVKRQILSGVQGDDRNSYASFGNYDYTIEAGETKPITIKVETESDFNNAGLYFSLGRAAGDNVTPDESTVTISNIAFVELGANLLTNADFADGLNGWEETIANWDDSYVTDASSSIADGKITYSIKNPGTDAWHVQLKQKVDLEAGKNYVMSYKVTSDTDRMILSGVQHNGKDNNYSPFGSEDFKIEANETKEISIDITSETDYADAVLYFSLGRAGGDEITPDKSEVTISDVKFYVSDEKLDVEEVEISETSYTSGRISTQNKQTFTYGLYEVRAKVPSGAGYLPAFWLMANDENIYGQWPRCGEIDCMEVLGQETDTVYGTIHYGMPNNQKQGSYKFTEEVDFANDFHTYTCDWQPGKITWYVDGVKYFETSDWYTTNGNVTTAYPAPFDQPFYIILNLAVGGDWVGMPDEHTFDENNDYVIDYVRVYQKADYDENVEKPESKFEPSKEPINGSYIYSPSSYDGNWEFKTALGGEAQVDTVTCDDNATAIKISTANQGTVDYSVQLMQSSVPLEKNKRYKVSFDAWASESRKMSVAVKSPSRNYFEYLEGTTTNLSTASTSFEYTFDMLEESDDNARLEFNMGAADSTADIYIRNVSLEYIEDIEVEPEPEVLYKPVKADGNYLYNGSFNEGTNHLGDWEISSQAVGANYYVTSFSDGRRLKVTAPTNAKVLLKQTKVDITPGKKYLLAFDAESTLNSTANAFIGEISKDIVITSGKKTYTAIIEVPEAADKDECSIFELVLNGKCDVSIDNIKLSEFGMITDGDFASDSLGSYEFWTQQGAAEATASVVNGEAVVSVNKTGTADWHIQLKQNNLKIEQGNMYVLSFKAKSNVDRKVRVLIQGPESRGWDVYSKVADISNEEFAVTSEYKDYTVRFIMDKETDPNAFLSICLGNVDREINEAHNVSFDDIKLDVYVPVCYDGETLYYPIGNKISDFAFKADGTQVSGHSLECSGNIVGFNTGIDGTGDDVTGDTVVTAPMDIYEITENESDYWMLSLDKTSFCYTGSSIKPVVTLKNGDKVLELNKDYKVTYKNNINSISDETPGDKRPTVTVTFIGNYAGTEAINRTFYIYSKDISDPDVTVGTVKNHYNYNKNGVKPVPSVTVEGKKLASSKLTYKYYTSTISDVIGEEVTTPKKPGDYVLVISGKNGYEGTIKRNFTILTSEEKNVDSLSIKVGNTSVPYSGVQIGNEDLGKTFAITIKNGSTKLIEGVDYEVSTDDNTVNVGKINLKILGIYESGYYGTKIVQVSIKGKALKNATVSGIGNLPYDNGNPVEQTSVKVKYGKNTVLNGIAAADYENAENKTEYDYVYEYANNTECGTASITFTGVNNYTGSVTKTFKITGKNISKAKVEGFKSSVTYVGKPVVMDLNLNMNGEKIRVIEKSKYDSLANDEARRNFKAVATYKNNSKVGTATVVITGINGFEGKISRTITIKAYNIGKDSGDRVFVKLSQTAYEYDKSGVKPVPVVKFNGVTLTKGVDYKLSYENNKSLGSLTSKKKPTVKVIGKGNYSGTNITCHFEIVKAQLEYHATVTASNVKYANEKNNYKTTVKVVDENGNVLKAGKDYKVKAYYEADKAETAIATNAKVEAPSADGKKMIVKIEGCGNYEPSVLSATYNMYTYDISKYTFTLNADVKKYYNGKPVVISPSELTVTDKGKPVSNAADILANIDVDASSYKNNVNAGTATVNVIGKGNYGGTKKATFKISGKVLYNVPR